MKNVDPTRAGLARALRDLRTSRGLTIEELSTEAGVHSSYLRRIEHRRSSPTWDRLTRLAEALGVPLSEIARTAEAHAQARAPSDRQ